MELNLIVASFDRPLLTRCEEYCAFKNMFLRTVDGGVECLTELRRSVPDVLVLDLDLPWGSGDGVLDIMRDEAGLEQIPVVLMYDDGARLLERGLPANVVGWLTKPLDVDALFESAFWAADCREIVHLK